ncbi:hypothetical protein [Gordonia sp. NPDC003950]
MGRPRSDTDRAAIRASPIDRHHSRRRSALVFGPVATPAVPDAADRLAALAARGAWSRIGLHPSPAASRWPFDPTAGGHVVRAAADPGDDPLRLLDEVRTRGGEPLRVAIGGDHIAIDFDHGLGDARLMHTVVDVALGVADPTDDRLWHRYRHRLPPLAVASARIAADPRRLVALARLTRRPDRTPPRPLSSSTRTVVQPDVSVSRRPRAHALRIPSDTVAAVRSARDEHRPGVTLYALTTAALVDVLDTAGVALDPVVTAPFDARAYLPEDRSTLANFSAGLAFEVAPGTDPTRLHHELTEAARIGRPVANLVATEAKTRLAAMFPSHRPAAPTSPSSVHLLHSSVGHIPGSEDRWRWLDDERAQVLAVADPPTPYGITVTTAMVGGGMSVATAYFDAVVPGDAVDTAMNLLPLRMLELASMT